MQIIIQRIPYSSSEFEYNTSNSSSNGIVYSLIQHLSEIFGDIVGFSNSSNLLSFSFQTSATTVPPAHLYDTPRKQWISDKILDSLLRNHNPDSDTKVLAICNFDDIQVI
jgi:hypothetical protein